MIISIEGGDQAGKKTQSGMLAKALRKEKIKVKSFSFPDYSTHIGMEIKKYLEGRRKFPPQVIHCLMAANRWEKIEEIKKANLTNSVLIMNRYYHSNLVYGIANGLKEKWLTNLDEGLPKSDLVILLDIQTEKSFERKKDSRDKFEKNRKFLKKISSTYRHLAKKEGWKVVDGSKNKNEIHDEIMQVFRKKIGL